MSSKTFEPDWTDQPPTTNSYRSIFKWGAPGIFKHPNHRFYEMLKTALGMHDADFIIKSNTGDENVKCQRPVQIDGRHIQAFEKIVGNQNISAKDYDRVKFSSGKTMEEILALRQGIVGDTADLVVHPRNRQDVRKIIDYCHVERIPVYVFGGGSSVTLGLAPVKGGISLVMGTHMNRMLSFNEQNQTITVEPGMMGATYEAILNHAPQKLKARRRFTGGHFPQSFEYSSVGGWIVTLGSGQASSYYGDIYDMVLGQEYVTPIGDLKTNCYAAAATGPRVNDIMKGSEGSFGVLVAATMKIYRYQPENRRHFTFLFPHWHAAVDAVRDISQGQFGMPAVLRISDAEETAVGLKLYGMESTWLDHLLARKGFKPGRCCLCIGTVEGEKRFAENIKKNIKKVSRSNGAMSLTGYPARHWEQNRFRDPYLREDLNDFGIVIDTLETSVSWDNLHKVHRSVRHYIKDRPNTICLSHASHFYPQGTNLYFIFIARLTDIAVYKRFQEGVIDSIEKAGGSLSHHHGIGKMLSPWMERHLGAGQMNVLRALKQHFDPHNIMNPGGTLGLDLTAERRRS